jgi:hypothetical protein
MRVVFFRGFRNQFNSKFQSIHLINPAMDKKVNLRHPKELMPLAFPATLGLRFTNHPVGDGDLGGATNKTPVPLTCVGEFEYLEVVF